MEKSREILKKYWGFDSFRPMQETIVDDVIYGHDVLALLPTGGGKSICFQVPGIALEGVVVVISPLIALMQDQVSSLQKRGIKAIAITGGMSEKEIDIAIDNARFGGYKFLYTSPERINSRLFQELFKLMKVALIVVDEAHCISEWGHDFRPSFRTIAPLRTIQPKVPVCAVTATATEKVKEDIILQLQLQQPKIHEASFERNNLSYNVIKTDNKLQAILDHCKNNSNQCGIVYCQTRRSVKEIAKFLYNNKISTGIYHGGLNSDQRTQMLNDWLQDRIKVMVATNAFGMGIDKPDVRYVLHYEVPFSIEAYFQEAGRAGRDLQYSSAIAFWRDADLTEMENRLISQFPSIDTIKRTYLALCNYLKIAIGSGKDESYYLDLDKFCKTFNLNVSETFSSLKILETNKNISVSDAFSHSTSFMFTVGNRELYNFQISNEKIIPITSLLSRSYNSSFDSFVKINEHQITKRLNQPIKTTIDQLTFLEKNGIISITWSNDLPSITFLTERLPDNQLTIYPEAYQFRKERAQVKMDAICTFLIKEDCRSKQLLHYFGQSGNECGICDICKKNSRTNDLHQESLLDFCTHGKTLFQIENHFTQQSKEIKEMLQGLLNAGKLSRNNDLFTTI